jgi:hypothetical protein
MGSRDKAFFAYARAKRITTIFPQFLDAITILSRAFGLAIGFHEKYTYITIAMKADRYLFIAQYQLILKVFGICSLQAPVRCFVRCHT